MVLPKALEGARDEGADRGRIAVLSDIHSNWHALQAVLEWCAEKGVERFFCLGDIVGYGANPRECLDAIRNLHCPTVLGNHDESVASGGRGDLNPIARLGVEYSMRMLDADRRAWLGQLPFTLHCGVATLVHASLEEPQDWIYILDAFSAEPSLELQETPICFHGHTHRPAIYCREDLPVATKRSDGRFQIPKEGRTLVNVGSVGQPRDGNPRSRFVIFDPDEMTVELVGVSYDVEGAASAILEAGLPKKLAFRLFEGR